MIFLRIFALLTRRLHAFSSPLSSASLVRYVALHYFPSFQLPLRLPYLQVLPDVPQGHQLRYVRHQQDHRHHHHEAYHHSQVHHVRHYLHFDLEFPLVVQHGRVVEFHHHVVKMLQVFYFKNRGNFLDSETEILQLGAKVLSLQPRLVEHVQIRALRFLVVVQRHPRNYVLVRTDVDCPYLRVRVFRLGVSLVDEDVANASPVVNEEGHVVLGNGDARLPHFVPVRIDPVVLDVVLPFVLLEVKRYEIHLILRGARRFYLSLGNVEFETEELQLEVLLYVQVVDVQESRSVFLETEVLNDEARGLVYVE